MRFFYTFILFSASLFAGAVTISVNGTFGSVSGSFTGAPYFVPDSPFTLSFRVGNPPVTTNASTVFTNFSTTYSNAVYTVGGASVAVTGNTVQFGGIGYPVNNPMGFCLDAPCDFELFFGDNVGRPQFYTGSETSPTIVPGAYPVDGVFCDQ